MNEIKVFATEDCTEYRDCFSTVHAEFTFFMCYCIKPQKTSCELMIKMWQTVAHDFGIVVVVLHLQVYLIVAKSSANRFSVEQTITSTG